MKEPIVFKCEPSLWLMMLKGVKTWDARLYDMADDRIYRLAWGRRLATSLAEGCSPGTALMPDWRPDEPSVSFQNGATGEILTFRYLGMEFTPWAPGWVFLLLGERVDSKDEKGG